MANWHIFLVSYSIYIDDDGHPLADDSNIDYVQCLMIADSEKTLRREFYETDSFLEEIVDLGSICFLTQDAADAIKECI